MNKKLLSILLVLVLIASVLPLSGCTEAYIGEVNVYNWGEFIDMSALKDFEEEYKIKVNYTTFASNEVLYSNLKTGGGTYDVIICSDYMISRLINEGFLAELNWDNIPNYDAYVDEQFRGMEFDPDEKYSVPYMRCTTGLIYNSAMVDEEITSWGAMFDEKYAGSVLMFDNSRDAMAIALLYLGYSINTTNEAELNEAYELLASKADMFQGFYMDQMFDKLEAGEAAIGAYYAGDYLTMLENNPDLRFVIPEEGANQSMDSMCVLRSAKNKEYAEKFINYMTRPDVAVRNMDFTWYSSPIPEAVEEFSAELDELTLSVMFPSDEVLSKCEVFVNLPQNILDLYDSLWIKLKS